MTSNLTIALQDNLLELVQTLGEPATVAPAAVRRYVVDRSLQRLEAAEERVILGFDSHADHTALGLKYGDNYAAHIFDLVPHRHGPDKTTTMLTEPWDAVRFLPDLDSLLASE